MLFAHPYNILDLKDGESRDFSVSRIDEGEIEIARPGEAHPRYVPAIRVYHTPNPDAVGMPYLDITSQTLRAQILPWVATLKPAPRAFRVTAHGTGVGKRFAVKVL